MPIGAPNPSNVDTAYYVTSGDVVLLGQHAALHSDETDTSHYLLWVTPTGVIGSIKLEGISSNEARIVLQSLRALSDIEWNAIAASPALSTNTTIEAFES